MIEFVYKEKAKEEGPERKLDLPKNVRQIGEPEENRKIYIEDYVITYLKRFAKEEPLGSRIAVLLGDSERMGGIPYLFIRSAVALKELEYSEGGIPFTDEVWAEVYSAVKEYFPAQDILGWFLSVPGYPMELDPGLARIHVNCFGGVDKVLLAAEPTDGDEDFFAYENGRLTRQKGYYIFYEKNEAMQRFMIDTGDGESIDEKEQFEDRAIKSFRAIVQEKKDISGQKRVMTFLYTASTFLVMVVLVIGITLINNYEKMEGLEMALSDISRTLESQEAEEALAETETWMRDPQLRNLQPLRCSLRKKLSRRRLRSLSRKLPGSLSREAAKRAGRRSRKQLSRRSRRRRRRKRLRKMRFRKRIPCRRGIRFLGSAAGFTAGTIR